MPRRHSVQAVCAGALLALPLSGCATLSAPRPNVALGHFFQVDPDLYRGAQPTVEGFRQLRAMGVKTVISLRAQSRVTRQHERELVESLGMRWVSLPMRMYWRPQDAYTEALSLGLAEWNPFMRGLILREASRYGEPTSQLVSTR